MWKLRLGVLDARPTTSASPLIPQRFQHREHLWNGSAPMERAVDAELSGSGVNSES
jgi:hypothetical protein